MTAADMEKQSDPAKPLLAVGLFIQPPWPGGGGKGNLSSGVKGCREDIVNVLWPK